MANREQILSAGIGAAIGFFVGGGVPGAIKGFQLGLLAGSALFPLDLPSVQGPRLEDFETVEADPGAPLPRVYGTAPLPGYRMYLGPVTEVTTTETHGGKGAPEQDVTTFTYLQTLAIGLCSGPIRDVTRIWENGTLMYDSRPQQVGESVSAYQDRLFANAQYVNDTDFVLYTGTETQTADPTLEAELGAGNVPPFRSLAYIVFPNRLLKEDQGRRHPLWKFEVEGSAAEALVIVGDERAAYSLDGGATWTQATQPPVDSGGASEGDCRTVYHDTIRRRFVALGGNDAFYSEDNGDTWTPVVGACNAGGSTPLCDSIFIAAHDLAVACKGGGGGSITNRIHYSYDGGVTWSKVDPPLPDNSWVITGICHKETTDQLVCLCANGTGSGGIIYADAADPTDWTFQGGLGRASGFRRGIAYASHDDRIVAGQTETSSFQSFRCRVSAVGSITSYTLEDTGGGNNGDARGVAYAPSLNRVGIALSDTNGSRYVWSSNLPSAWGVVSTVDFPYLAQGLRYFTAQQKFYSVHNGRVGFSEAGQADWEFVEVTGSWHDIASGASAGGVTLASVVSDVCAAAGVTAIDASELDDVRVIGYVIPRPMNARSALDPLRMVGQFDYVERGETLIFRRRGGAAVATLEASELGARLGGQDRQPAITTRKVQDYELPRQVRVRYLSYSREYERSEQLSPPRISTASVNDVTIDVPVVIEDELAAQLAEIAMRDAWASRYQHETTLDQSWAALEPADPIIVPLDGRNHRMRIVSVRDRALAVRAISAVRDDDGAYVSTAATNPPLRTGSSLNLLGTTDIDLLDLPPLDEADDNAGLYLASYRTGNGQGWSGAWVHRSVDGGETYAALLTTAQQAIVGTVVTVPSGDSRTWNDDTELVVDVLNGMTLESRTKAAVLAGANAAAIGADGRWQIVQWQNAELVSTGRYRLTRLLLGRRATEHNIAGVQVGDRFVLVSGPGMYEASLQIAAIGNEYLYRPVTVGASFETGVDVAFTGAGERLSPFSPVRVRGARDGSGNLTITGMRRDRLSQALRDGVAVPNSEASESYEVDILDGANVVRTISGLSSPTAIYTAAEQTTDFGSVQSPVSLRFYQLSATVGRGTPAEATV